MKKLFILLCVLATVLQAQITLVKKGVSEASVLYNPDAELAMNLLDTYLLKSTGTTLPRIQQKSKRPMIVFNVDTALDIEEFKVDFPDKRTILISSGSSYGLKIAVLDFLERHLGIRWLFPGELGEVVPKHATLKIKREAYADKPCFLSRFFSGGNSPEALEFQEHMRARRYRVEFHHNLYNLYHPDVFAESNPEFYPVYDGKRYIPKPEDKDTVWQPCYSAPGISEAGAARIIAELDKKPECMSYSLGINDTTRQCQCPECLKVVNDRKNFNGNYHYSELYIPFANKIAEIVSQKYPECKLGFLAYNEILEPAENVKLHDALVPYMTFDRMMWLDKDKEKNGHELTERWKAVSNELGWYDYMYGKFYDLPRIYMHKSAEYLKWGYEHGVRHHYGEYYPRDDWHEGPKYYIIMKLLWDVNLDVDKTLDEWYTLAVGPKAAPYLKEYFDRLEAYWTYSVPKTNWFKKGRQWLNFNSVDYLEKYSTVDLKQSEELLLKVVELSDNKERAEFFLFSFLNSKPKIIRSLEKFGYCVK